jgi:hypothetical protein
MVCDVKFSWHNVIYADVYRRLNEITPISIRPWYLFADSALN